MFEANEDTIFWLKKRGSVPEEYADRVYISKKDRERMGTELPYIIETIGNKERVFNYKPIGGHYLGSYKNYITRAPVDTPEYARQQIVERMFHLYGKEISANRKKIPSTIKSKRTISKCGCKK